MNALEHALQFIRSGIAIIPLHHRSKVPDVSLIGGAWEQYKTILSTEQDACHWLATGWCNYGVVAGWCGLVVLDFDTQFIFDLWHSWWCMQGGAMPYVVHTARGAHVYVACALEANEKRQGVDVKCHGYVVGPGSIHPNGTQYVADGDFYLHQVDCLETILPVALFPKIAQNASGRDSGAFHGEAVAFTPVATEYDPWQSAMWVSDADLISTVKSRVRIETLFSKVYKTSNSGQWYAALCPFHDDHSPSMWIDVKRQICGCQVCGMKPMDAINLYARMHGMDERAAVSALAKEVGVWG
jgi:hypothetical protein